MSSLKPDSLSERFDNNNAYWTEKYIPREPTPWFLDDTTKTLALNAGKYVNALREITSASSETTSSDDSETSVKEEQEKNSIVVARGTKEEEKYKTITFSNISDVVRSRHDVSNKHFFDGLLISGDIRNKLRLVKATFLLAQRRLSLAIFRFAVQSVRGARKTGQILRRAKVERCFRDEHEKLVDVCVQVSRRSHVRRRRE